MRCALLLHRKRIVGQARELRKRRRNPRRKRVRGLVTQRAEPMKTQ